MKARWLALVAFLNAREDPIGLALARIVLCTTLAAHVTRFLASGAAELAFLPHDHGGLSGDPGWLEPVGVSEASITALAVACIVAALAGALGIATRPALVVLWLSFRALSSLNSEAKGSYDALLIDTLFVLMLSGCGRALSLDARFFASAPRTSSRWPRTLLVVQLGSLYFGSALVKASSGWVPGGDASALWYILQQPTWARFPTLPLWAYPLTQVATTLVWLFEISAPLFVLAALLRETAPSGRVLAATKRALDRARFLELYLAFGLLMHLGIEATMEVGPFSFAALALYPAALAPERWRRWMDAVRARFEVIARRPATDRGTT
jgi:uncharacterized membrane protein YphA (DoxX/SURF4 family)